MPTASDLAALIAWLPPWPLVAAAVAGTLALLLLAGVIRRTGVRRAAVAVAATVGIITSAETMWLVAGQLGASGPWRAIPAVLFESAMVATAARAREKFHRDGAVGKFGPRMWMFALGAGSVAALVGGPVAIILMRFLAPLVAAAVVLDEFTDHDRKLDIITLKVGLRRLLVRWGLAEAGARNLTEVEREHRVHRLAVAADRLHHGWAWTRRWRRWRLRRLARHADDPMVAEVQERVRRIHWIEDSTAPDAGVRQPRTAEDLTRAEPEGSRLVSLPEPEPPAQTNGHRELVLTAAVPARVEQTVPARKPARAGSRSPESRQQSERRVAAYLAEHPDAPAAQVAKALNMPESSARRHINTIRARQEGPAGE